jgi:hypothetical protein
MACLFAGGGSSSTDDDEDASRVFEGAPADVIAPGDILEAARSAAAAAVAAMLPDDAALLRLADIRARAAAEARDAVSDLNLQLAAQRAEVRESPSAGAAAAAAAAARRSPRCSKCQRRHGASEAAAPRCAAPQLQTALAAVSKAGENCATLRDMSRRVDALCEARARAHRSSQK